MQVPRIIKDISIQGFAAYFGTATQLLKGVVLAKLLGPENLGAIATVGIVLAYSQYSDLGIASAIGREIPMAIGAKRADEIQEWIAYGLSARLLSGLLIGLCLIVYVLLNPLKFTSDIRFGLLTTSIVIVAQGFTSAQQTILQSKREFGRAALLVIAVAAIGLISGLIGVVAAGVKGVFMSQLFTFVLSAALGFYLIGKFTLVRLDGRKLWHLIKIGLPLVLLAFMSYNLIYVDQIMILGLLGQTALGTYTIVLYAGSALYIFPAAVAGAVGPRLLGKYGKTNDLQDVSELTWKPVRGLSILLPPLIMSAWVFIPIFISNFLPKYTGAIGPLRVYLLGMFFLGLNSGVSTILLALGKHSYNIPIVGVVIVGNIALDMLFVSRLHFGLIGIALGSAVTYFIYWLLHASLVRWHFDRDVFRMLAFNLQMGWPGLFLGLFGFMAWRTRRIGASFSVFDLVFLAVVSLFTLIRWAQAQVASNAEPEISHA